METRNQTTADIIDLLRLLKKDPAVVILLYPRLANSAFLALVRRGTSDNPEFLTYPTETEVTCIPLFTQTQNVNIQNEAFEVTQIKAPALWKRLLEITAAGKIEIELDPGHAHGIRITRPIVQSILNFSRPS